MAFNMHLAATTSSLDRGDLENVMERALAEMRELRLEANAGTFNSFGWAAFKRNDMPLAKASLCTVVAPSVWWLRCQPEWRHVS